MSEDKHTQKTPYSPPHPGNDRRTQVMSSNGLHFPKFSHRSGSGGPHGKNHPRSMKLGTRAERAAERKDHRDSLSPGDQLKRLDQRLGEGVGAKRERERLHAQILSRVTVESEK